MKTTIEIGSELYIRLCNAYQRYTGQFPNEDGNIAYLLRQILDHWEKWEKEKA